MAAVAKSSGGAYCIDQTEVTKGQYNKFLTANVPAGDQTGACGPASAGAAPANANFVPRGAWPPATTPGLPSGGIAFSMGLPVHYVDWCDAAAYCKWANKQLCGKINGGPVAPIASNDAAQDAWYNACSAQGTRGWPYSTVFDNGKCNGRGDGIPGIYQTNLRDGYGFGGANQDTGVYDVVASDASGNITGQATHHAGCQGGSVNVFQMSGNVAEWEDSCDGTTPTSSCNLRGGSYAAADTAATLRCDAPRTEVRLPVDGNVLADVGVRCCLY
jgi:formylglycine-generating enzyme required for sulfatase activity